MAGSQPGQYKTWPLGGATRRAAILESVVRVLDRLVDLLANESSEIDQATDKDLPANESSSILRDISYCLNWLKNVPWTRARIAFVPVSLISHEND